MKNVLIINSYANDSHRRSILIKCITQLKKLNIDIILSSNYTDDKNIQDLVTYYLYDSDNFLLPKQKSPIKWYADTNETIHIFQPGNSYIVYKHMYSSINFAKLLGYEKFLYLEFDVDFSDEDLNKINFIFDECLSTKQMWMCNFLSYGKQAYESRLFAGNINFFLNNFIKINSKEKWFTTLPFSSNSDTLEFILPLILSRTHNRVYFTDMSICEFFKTSKFDICQVSSNIYISYNTESIDEPILFIITKRGEYKIFINNNLEYLNIYNDNRILKYKFKIYNHDSNIRVLFNNDIIYEKNVNLKNIETFKNECVRYKL
jgi:hypothetical protein